MRNRLVLGALAVMSGAGYALAEPPPVGEILVERTATGLTLTARVSGPAGATLEGRFLVSKKSSSGTINSRQNRTVILSAAPEVIGVISVQADETTTLEGRLELLLNGEIVSLTVLETGLNP